MPLLRVPVVHIDAPHPPVDEIIDVRAPEEFAIDHIPGAINLPVLDDAQRKTVGTIYKQESPFAARKIGAAHITENIARYIDEHFAEKPKGYRPLIYCWRGGQRSHSLASILDAIGWYVRVMEGGYKAYRTTVIATLNQRPAAFRFVVVGGMTGSGKTRLLHAIRAQGGQIIDLEGMANHKGSLLGNQPDGQPSQKAFETQLAAALNTLNTAQPVFVESESSRIGDIHLPTGFWEYLRRSPRVELRTTLEDRIQITREEYPDFIADPEALIEKLNFLKEHRGKKMVEDWSDASRAGAWDDLIRSLLTEHYDPSYSHAQKTNYNSPLAEIRLASPDDFDSAAKEFIAKATELTK